jgi:pimeloyl-ACP methyl ester carboxylesterase
MGRTASRNAVAAAVVALEAGDRDGAARIFIDFWMGDGSWKSHAAAASGGHRRLRRQHPPLGIRPGHGTDAATAFASVRVPVLYMVGEHSPEPAQAVARILLPVLPHVRAVHLPGLGHMAPVTHPERVNAEIARFLAEV